MKKLVNLIRYWRRTLQAPRDNNQRLLCKNQDDYYGDRICQSLQKN